MPERGVRLNFDSEIKANTAIKLLTENDIIEQNLPSLEDVFLTLIDDKNRLVYKVEDNQILILQLKGHYSD